jgi:hypothetical protein
VKIADAAGKALAENSYDIASKDIPAPVPAQKDMTLIALFSALLILCAIGLIAYFVKKKKSAIPPIAIFLALMLGFGLFFFGEEVRAVTRTVSFTLRSYGGWEGNYSTNFYYDLDSASRIYSRGAPMTISGSGDNGPCDNTAGGNMAATVNGDLKTFMNQGVSPAGGYNPDGSVIHSVYQYKKTSWTYTVPTTPGSYIADFDFYHKLYNHSSWIRKSGGNTFYGTDDGNNLIPFGGVSAGPVITIPYTVIAPACGGQAKTYAASATGWPTDGSTKCSPEASTVPGMYRSPSGSLTFPAAGSSLTWTCGDAQGSVSCTARHSQNGVCSGTAGSCSVGSASGDNYASCGTRTWTCSGVLGGNSTPCSKSLASCAVNGACSGSGCSAGNYAEGNIACNTTHTWSCTGTGGGSTASCSGTANRACYTCTLTGDNHVVNHNETHIAFQSSSVPYGNSCVSQNRKCVDGSFQSGSYGYSTCNVSAATAPTNPTISVAGNCATTIGIVDVPKTFTFTGTDTNTPKLDIRYGVDWNKDGTIDLWTSPYVSSGTGQAVSHTWTAVGVTSFQVLTGNSQLKNSGWTSCNTIDIRAAAALGSGCRDYTKTETKFDAISLMCAAGTPVHGDGSAFSGSAPYDLPPAGSPLDYKCNNGVGNDSPICAFTHTNVTCGSAADTTEPTKPKTNLCSDGSTPPVTLVSGKWKWTCGGVVSCESPKGKFNFVES